ncbi:sugar ABC transporter substrate-binding protein, partial [Nocardioides sp. GCM10030258]|uniref:sugar ABC transporter substrate-binding protein n=1 Tax=unclassified Nocardioides TaxID=2615069 RepID=UPI00360F82E9
MVASHIEPKRDFPLTPPTSRDTTSSFRTSCSTAERVHAATSRSRSKRRTMSKRTHVVQADAAVDPGSRSPRRGQRAVALLALGALMSFAAACGESAGGGGGTTTPEVVAEAKAAVAKNREGTDRALPASAPKPQADQNVWVISCTQAAEGCSQPAAGAKEAGESIGWDMTVFDGKGSPDVFAEGIRSAVADKADAIILDAVDCVAVKSALQEAREADVKIYGIFSMDCDDPFVGGEPLFDAQLT